MMNKYLMENYDKDHIDNSTTKSFSNTGHGYLYYQRIDAFI